MIRMQARLSSLYAALICLAGIATAPLQAQDNELNWLGDYREALQQAKKENKPIFLEFRCEA
jgi:hypothetical protein